MTSATKAIHLDGQRGEGGGQILRTALSLSAALGRPLQVENVRAGRKKPGLLRQHLTALRACAQICDAELAGDELGSAEVEFRPGAVRAGSYEFAVGSAGSAMLVLQTVLPVLLCADGESEVVVQGGTHNPWAPPFEAIERSFAPLLCRTGCGLELRLERHGFHPAGGGRVYAKVRPSRSTEPLELLTRGAELEHDAEALVAHLSDSIGERELKAAAKRLPWIADRGRITSTQDSDGPGNVVHVTMRYQNVTEVFTQFGTRGVTAEAIGKKLAQRVARYTAGGRPVGEHLADQLMLPLALLAGGRYETAGLSPHARTNEEVINAFLPGSVTHAETEDGAVVVTVAARGSR